MSAEDTYKIAMISLAGIAGFLLITLVVTCCCCHRYKRKLKGGGSKVRFGKQGVSKRKSAQWEVSPYAGWGASVQGRSACGCPGTPGCTKCQQSYATAYDWLPSSHNDVIMTSAPAVIQNPYVMNPTQIHQAPNRDFGRVLLNAPSAVCTKPKLNSTPVGGSCGTGGAACGNFYNMSSSQPITGLGSNMSNSTAQFVLESCPKPF
jgi:hypothetical protein